MQGSTYRHVSCIYDKFLKLLSLVSVLCLNHLPLVSHVTAEILQILLVQRREKGLAHFMLHQTPSCILHIWIVLTPAARRTHPADDDRSWTAASGDGVRVRYLSDATSV